MKVELSNSFGWDPACLELAEHFLADEPDPNDDASLRAYKDRASRLAQAIQIAVEAFFVESPAPEVAR